MTREPDRYEAKGEELACAYHTVRCPDRSTLARQIAAALRDEHREALELAAQEVEAAKSSDRFAATQAILARRIRALASPAAAHTAEPDQVSRLLGRGYVEHPREGEPGDAETYSEPVAPEKDCPEEGCVLEADHSGSCDTDIPDPVAPSVLPRVLAVLDAEYRRRGGDDGGGYVGALAAELRRYIAEHDPAEKRIAELESLLRDIEKTLAGHRERDGASPATVSEIVLKIVRKLPASTAARTRGE